MTTGRTHPDFGEWQPIETAPRDGSRILVMLRASEQGPAEVDLARWERSPRAGDSCWIASDSDPDCEIIYAESDLEFWMPLPMPTPKMRTSRARPATRPSDIFEMDGSSI